MIAGPIAKELGDRYHCKPQRIASILDTGSCVVQGLIPYGAQILIALGVAQTSGITISTAGLLSTQYYQFLMLGAVIISLLYRKKA